MISNEVNAEFAVFWWYSCWLSSGKAIWTFAAPMVAIILVSGYFGMGKHGH